MPYKSIADRLENARLKRRVNGRSRSKGDGKRKPAPLGESLNPQWTPRERTQAPEVVGPPPGFFVSKSNIIDYWYCPYAFHLTFTGVVDRRAISDVIAKRLDAGIEFEGAIVSEAAPLPPSMTWAKLLKRDEVVLGVPVFRNEELRLVGRPDGIRTARGALAPIEIKKHGGVHESDVLELAFYWLLLEPHRTKFNVDPFGIVIYETEEGDEERVVPLEPAHFEEVYSLIAAVRFARRDGVRPSFCLCMICATRVEARESIGESRDFKVIYEVGRHRGSGLTEIGLRDVDDFMTRPSGEIVLKLREIKRFVSVATVDRWKFHIIAYRDAKPLFFAAPRLASSRYIVVDLEYDDNVWLFGYLTRDRTAGTCEVVQCWADNRVQRESALDTLERLLSDDPTIALFTWGGASADLPQLRNICLRHDRRLLLEMIERRHIDLCAVAKECVRFPIRDLGLDTASEYLGQPRVSGIRNGLEAGYYYYRYRKTRKKAEKGALQRELLRYNLDDLEGTRAIAEFLLEQGCVTADARREVAAI